MWRLRPCCHTCHVRCLLVDDNSAFIETARLLLAREGMVVAGTASSIAEALRQASALRPDVVLVDIALGEENGFDLDSSQARYKLAYYRTSRPTRVRRNIPTSGCYG